MVGVGMEIDDCGKQEARVYGHVGSGMAWMWMMARSHSQPNWMVRTFYSTVHV